MTKLLLSVLIAVSLAGCSTFALDKEGQIDATGVKGYAACIEGSGPPMTGSGKLARAKVDKDFKGEISISGNCDIKVRSD